MTGRWQGNSGIEIFVLSLEIMGVHDASTHAKQSLHSQMTNHSVWLIYHFEKDGNRIRPHARFVLVYVPCFMNNCHYFELLDFACKVHFKEPFFFYKVSHSCRNKIRAKIPMLLLVSQFSR